MAGMLNDTKDLKNAAARLISRANERGGPDNVTVVLARWVQG
jgi:serine/threonine protein phosphatase PrpC